MENYEEISLKELILLLVNGWKVILLTTLLILGIASSVFVFANPETLTLSSKATLTYSPNYVTRYGSFNSGLNKAEDVLTLIQDDYYDSLQETTTYTFPVEDLKPHITFSVSAPNELTLTYTGLDKVSLEILQSNVAHTLSTYLSTQLQDKAKKQFLLELSNARIQASMDYKKNEELIALYDTELKNTEMLLTSTILNPAYASIASRLQDLKNSNLVLEYTSSQIDKHTKELNTLDYEETLPFIGIYADVVNNTDVVVTQQFSAKTLFPISLVLGVMVGVFLVLFINYWKSAD